MAENQKNILGVPYTFLNYTELVNSILKEIGEPKAVTALAVHGLMESQMSPDLKCMLSDFYAVTPDGQPIRWAINLIHKVGLKNRICGSTLTLKILEECEKKQLKPYFYGSQPDVLKSLQQKLSQKFPNLQYAGFTPSKFKKVNYNEIKAIAEDISKTNPDVVFIGLGCPRQEIFTWAITPLLNRPVLAVGAAFDYHAGMLARAPVWMQDKGLEWLFRLFQEPKRLWRRYLYLNPWYCWEVFCQLSKLKKHEVPVTSLDKSKFEYPA